MQLSLFVFGLLANVISAVPTPETQSICLNVRKMQPQPQIYGWESASEYLVFHKGSYPSVKMSRTPNFAECPIYPGAGYSLLGNLYNTLSIVLHTNMPIARGGYVVCLVVAVVVAVAVPPHGGQPALPPFPSGPCGSRGGISACEARAAAALALALAAPAAAAAPAPTPYLLS
ncbi:hypothetical protein N7466_003051 [Penicillium verhagenii]|uniref:uncharacterized protein n=1 Tax=Penicillium verhagenii TaxID=1562060 RepID=UPI002545982B|nr:uncharacterized protein N7466_003051 [Penicillium verhagenii]KAJ5936601.1 hypothetical protein N7466_003051 [Penicillium verhagenii]